jgi:phage-related protein
MEITAEQMDVIRDATEVLREIFENLKEKFRELVKQIVDVLTPYLQKVMRWVRDVWIACLKAHARAAGMEKCYHLAFFARKRRESEDKNDKDN